MQRGKNHFTQILHFLWSVTHVLQFCIINRVLRSESYRIQYISDVKWKYKLATNFDYVIVRRIQCFRPEISVHCRNKTHLQPRMIIFLPDVCVRNESFSVSLQYCYHSEVCRWCRRRHPCCPRQQWPPLPPPLRLLPPCCGRRRSASAAVMTPAPVITYLVTHIQPGRPRTPRRVVREEVYLSMLQPI